MVMGLNQQLLLKNQYSPLLNLSDLSGVIVTFDTFLAGKWLYNKYYLILGHGIKTNDPVIAGNIFLKRDHKKILELLQQYDHGKLGVYMVPPMFFGKVPEAPKLHEYKEKNKEASVKCDISESKMFYALKRYFESTGDDVLIIHSHDFLTKNVDIHCITFYYA